MSELREKIAKSLEEFQDTGKDQCLAEFTEFIIDIIEKEEAKKLYFKLTAIRYAINTAFNTEDRDWMIKLDKSFDKLIEEVKELEERK